jgi:hypothetical protein
MVYTRAIENGTITIKKVSIHKMPNFQPQRGKFQVIKLLLQLLIIASVIGICITGFYAFTHKVSPILGVVSFFITVGLFICFFKLLQSPKYKRANPSFILVLGVLIGITVVCTFAGVQPLSEYKDKFFEKISNIYNVTNNENNTTTITPTKVTSQTQPPNTTTINNASPHGTYNAIAFGIQQTFTFSDDTLTRYDELEGKVIFKYYYTQQPIQYRVAGIFPSEPIYQPPPSTKVPASLAVTIWLQDITKGNWIPSTFKYIPDQDVIVLEDFAYYK